MKVRFKKKWTAPNGMTFEAGWVAGFPEKVALPIIKSGYADAVGENVRALRYAANAPVATECVVDSDSLPAAPKGAKLVPQVEQTDTNKE